MSRLRADKLTNKDGTGAPTFPNGVNITGVATATGGFDGTFTGNSIGNVVGNVTGNVTGNLTGGSTGTHTGSVVGDLTGNVTGTAATFSGNVSVGGTLTYEDVTSIDAVGMITARKGIQVLADGVNVVGAVTATTFVGDGANLTSIASPNANTISCVTAGNCKCDEANGRLPVFGGGNFQVFYSPGSFNTAGINSVRARAVGAGSYGCSAYWLYCGCLGPWYCFCNGSKWSGGVGGGYAHATVNTLPGSTVPVTVGCSWKDGSPTTHGTSKFWDKVCASGGIWPGISGCGYADPAVVSDVYCAKGGTGCCGYGGAAGSQLGDAVDSNLGSIAGANDPTEYSKQFPNRFPFDIFVGQCARDSTSQCLCNHLYYSCAPACWNTTDCHQMSSIRNFLQPSTIAGTGMAGANKWVGTRTGQATSCCWCYMTCKGGQGGIGAGGGVGGCYPGTGACAGGCGGLGGGGGASMLWACCYPTSCVSGCNQLGGEGGKGVVIVEW